jgi:molybdenum cofactor cytidylyltransferase
MSIVGGMVLAAGLSERMRGDVPKQMLPLGGLTLAGATVRNAEGSSLDRVVVVIGHRSDEVAAAVGEGRAEIVVNPEYRQGNMTSFRAGAAALAGCDAFVVLLADMPGVSSSMIDSIVAEWYRSGPWAAVSSYTDGPGHPLLLSAAALDEASQAQGRKGVWRFLNDASDRVEEIVFDSPMPTDVNTPEQYGEVLLELDTD